MSKKRVRRSRKEQGGAAKEQGGAEKSREEQQKSREEQKRAGRSSKRAGRSSKEEVGAARSNTFSIKCKEGSKFPSRLGVAVAFSDNLSPKFEFLPSPFEK